VGDALWSHFGGRTNVFRRSNGVEKNPPMNGYWWDETPEIAKTGFVIGHVAGIDHASKLLTEALATHETSLASASSDTPLASYMSFYEKGS
jgi:hypothetical protein